MQQVTHTAYHGLCTSCDYPLTFKEAKDSTLCRSCINKMDEKAKQELRAKALNRANGRVPL